MTNPNRCTQTQFLSQLVDNRLPPNQQTQLEAHVETCDTCQHTLDSLVEQDDTAHRLSRHLRRSEPIADTVLLNVIDRIRSTMGGMGSMSQSHTIRLDDFAVDYLHPAKDPESLGRLGPYEISEVIGSGGMGIVLKGHDAGLNRVVAVKVLAPVLALNSTARKRFLREAQAAAAISHPNVVTIYSVDEDRLPYLVMEFVDGPSLQQRLDSEGFLQLNQILRIGVQVSAGLAAAHAQGLVHRDIKPGNILLENGMERVRLTDFGLARAADDASVTRDGSVVGTPEYMSPEQARGESVDQASDLFSLGSVLYALATGRPPFRAESSYGVMRKITDETPVPIRELNPEIPQWLCSIINRLMAKEPSNRFPSVAEVHELLEACLSHAQQPTVTALPEIPALSATQFTFPFLKFFAGVVAMVTIAAGLVLAFGIPSMVEPNEQASQKATPEPYQKEFITAFAKPEHPGTLNVDIKRGSIVVTGYDGNKVVVELSVPNYQPANTQSSDGLKELRATTIDFDISQSDNQIKVDGNSYEYITNLTIKVPRKTNLILDSYRDGLIHVKQVHGTFNVRSQNNNIRLEQVSGAGKLRSYNGSLAADFERVTKNESLSFESYNGSIDVKLPVDTQANVRYRSGSGKMLTDFDVALSDDAIQTTNDGGIEYDQFIQGTLNGGGEPLILETEKGDIRLRKRSATK